MFRFTAVMGLAAIASTHAWAQPQIQSIVNSASFQAGVPSPGALATVFISGLNGNPVGLTLPPAGQPLPPQLAGLSIAINGVVAPILAVYLPPVGSSAYAQVNIQVPFYATALPGAPNTVLAATSIPTIIPSAEFGSATPSGLGGFFSDGNGFAIAQHSSDYSLVTTKNPAHPGETIIVYANDFFGTWPPPPLGIPLPVQYSYPAVNFGIGNGNEPGYPFAGRLLFLQSPPKVTQNPVLPDVSSCPNTPAVTVTFEGLAPGQLGVEQINFVVPASQQPGNWTLFFNTGVTTAGTNCSFGSVSSASVLLPVD